MDECTKENLVIAAVAGITVFVVTFIIKQAVPFIKEKIR